MADVTAGRDSHPIAEPASASRISPTFVSYLMGLTLFSLATSEFMVAGMMSSLSRELGISVSDVGYLISYFAAGMVIGGPLLTALLLKLKAPNKQAMLWLLGFYMIGGIISATATQYDAMALGRIIQGIALASSFGAAIAICGDLFEPNALGRASSTVFGGVMLSTVIGVPVATIIDAHFGWRATFWAVVGMALICTILIALMVPKSQPAQDFSMHKEVQAFRSGRLWAAYLTGALAMGATFAAFSYFSPIFTQVTGFPPSAVPMLLCVYGLSNVGANLVVGRYADRHPIAIVLGGLVALGITLAVFALLADNRIVAVVAFIGIGLFGIPLNPALIARVVRIAHPGPLVGTMHASANNIGIAAGAWLGGLAIHAGLGLRSPLWIGFGLAVLGLLSLAPRRLRVLAPARVTSQG